MKLHDKIQFNLQVLGRHRVRTALLLLAVGIGVASVILLTSLGEGARRYVDREFSAMGNNTLIIFPGKTETVGGMPPIYGATHRDLTLEDASMIGRISGVEDYAPIIAGSSLVSYGNRAREVITIGSTPGFFAVRQLDTGRGKILPESTITEAVAVCVLGAKLKRELFDNKRAIGEWVRIGDRRFRVIGVLSERGESLGLDLRDMVVIPVRSAEQLYNSPGLFRLMVSLKQVGSAKYIEERIRDIVKLRHEGEDDVTIVSQDSMLEAFNGILVALTLTIGAIASISLLVAGILIMNISLISVSQRRQEIGLLKAIGASSGQVRDLFLGESLLLVGLGCICGIAFATLVLEIANHLLPSFPMRAPWWSIVAAVVTAMCSGLLFSWLPSRRAASLDPVLAMRGIME